MSYSIVVAPVAERQLKKLAQKQPEIAFDLFTIIASLGSAPRPAGSAKLKKAKDTYRIRCGNHRLVYVIEDDVLLITVVGAGDRKDIYRYLK